MMRWLLFAAYPWLSDVSTDNRLERRLPPPDGYTRLVVAADSFGAWLRQLPLKPGRPPVLLYSGAKKANQDAHIAVVDIDIGERDLQQCADAVIRLRAEYLFSRDAEIAFHFTDGTWHPFAAWLSGHCADHPALRRYLDDIFVYAGTRSLERELVPVARAEEILPGDVFIKGGSPGHAMLVVDVAEDERTGARIFLLAQSYMPAQNIHVVMNPHDAHLSPWYSATFGEQLKTAEWVFRRGQLRRFDALDLVKTRGYPRCR